MRASPTSTLPSLVAMGLSVALGAACNCGHGNGSPDGGSGGGTGGGVAGSGGGAQSSGGGAGGGNGGSGPTCAPYDGGAWTAVGYLGVDDLFTVLESAPGDVWIQGDVLMRITPDGGFGPVCLSSPMMPCVAPRSMPGSCGPFVPAACDQTTVNLAGRGLWSAGPNDIWAGNNAGSVMQFTGTGWTSWNTADNRSVSVLFGSSASDVWGIDSQTGYAGHFDGMAWSHLGGCQGNALWLSDSAHVWTAGATGISEGSAPCGATELATATPMNALWGATANDVWSVGAAGVIAHRDAGTWDVMTPRPTTNDLNAIWGCSASNIWAAGKGGTLLHFDGAAWSPVSVPTVFDLNGVTGIGNETWVTGGHGTILHLQ